MPADRLERDVHESAVVFMVFLDATGRVGFRGVGVSR
jgi:hypothetical protein